MPHDPNRQLQSRALQGMRAMTPLLPGIVPFGLIAGFTPVSFGFTWFDAWAGSLLMFAGASQLAAYQLMNESASLWVILFTVAQFYRFLVALPQLRCVPPAFLPAFLLRSISAPSVLSCAPCVPSAFCSVVPCVPAAFPRRA